MTMLPPRPPMPPMGPAPMGAPVGAPAAAPGRFNALLARLKAKRATAPDAEDRLERPEVGAPAPMAGPRPY